MSSESQAASHSKGKGKGYFSCTIDMDRIMGTCFVDQMNQGNKLDGKCAWKPIAYTTVINTLQEQLNITVTKAHIQSRFKTWEKHYDILHPFLQSCNSGFAITWDHSRSRIEVHDEHVWKERFEANPKISPYRRKIVVENWEDICVLFSLDRANGEGAQTSFEANAEMDVEESINLEESFENDPQTLDHEVMNSLLARQGSKSKASSSSDSRGTKRKLTSSQALYKVLGRMANSLDKYLNSTGPRVTI
ncbi:hypothetical protein ACH5RR_013160 [Cinchona calisaya]|uniref:Myb/SANT-like domain-containing protein n=1 Tax=Cinchona calisaya TaxID=153742 RepID=A0ABD2ZZQ8_9GENT